MTRMLATRAHVGAGLGHGSSRFQQKHKLDESGRATDDRVAAKEVRQSLVFKWAVVQAHAPLTDICLFVS